jgi:hypothetical protein
MKKSTLNEELSRIQEMMGITHVSPSGKVTNMSPEDDDYEINYGKNAIQELSPSDMVNSMREEETDENEEILDTFKDQYGDKKGEKVYYATANKQDRDPETFEKNEESVIGGWDLTMEDSRVTPDNRVDYLTNALEHIWGMGRGNNKIDLHSMAQSLIDDMFGDPEENTDEIPGFKGTKDALDDLSIREEEKSFMQTRGGAEGPVYENEEMGEGRKFQQETYFETQAGALQSAEEYAIHKGYTVNWESINPEHVAYGKTVSYSVELMKDGVPSRKMLQISLYRMESGKYELTNYIN